MPLVDAIVGNAREADFAARPGLNAGPLDALVEIPRLAWREVIDETGRAASAAGIDAHADITIGHPLFRIDDFPALIAVARAVRDIRVLGDHSLPCARVAVLERQPLGVGTVTQKNGMTSRRVRPVHSGTKHQPVIHGNRDVPLDTHAIHFSYRTSI